MLGPENIPDRISWVCHTDARLLWNWYHADRCQLSTNCQILRFSQSIISQAAVCELVIIFRPTHNVTHLKTVLGPKNIPDVMSWVYQNDIRLLWNWYLSIVNCQQIIRFSDTRNPSQAKRRFVSWLQYYFQYIRFLEPCNGCKQSLGSISWNNALEIYIAPITTIQHLHSTWSKKLVVHRKRVVAIRRRGSCTCNLAVSNSNLVQ